jgi:hypothetical protein
MTTLLLLALSCPVTKIDNRTHFWNKQDKAALKRAHKGCRLYYPKDPCLKVFIKKESGLYNAICGSMS